jgi:hypothetical protein
MNLQCAHKIRNVHLLVSLANASLANLLDMSI